MWRRVCLVIALAAACAEPAFAQSDSALVRRVEVLEQMLGIKYLGKESAELNDSLNPRNTLPGGRYPYMLSDYQIRAYGIAPMQTQISGLAARLAVVEARDPVAFPPPSAGGTLIVDKLITKKLCVVDGTYSNDCDPDKAEQIQCRAAAGCAIGFNPNLNNAWRQADTPDGTGPGYVVMGVSPDLGWRVCQNQAWAHSGYKEYIIAKGKGCFGFDSQANFSIQQCEYGQPCLPGQSVVLLKQPWGWTWTAWQVNRPVCLQGSKSVYAAMDGAAVCSQ